MISRSLKEGLRGVGRHWAMSIYSAAAVTITLFIVSLFVVLTFHLQRFTKNLESEVKISVMIAYDSEHEDVEAGIRKQIEMIDGVKAVEYKSKDEEFQFYLDQFEDERTRKLFEPFGEDNPMHDAFYVETNDGSEIQAIAAQIEQIEGVDDVNYGGQSAVDMISAMEAVRKFGAVLVIGLSILAVFLIQNTINLTIRARQDEITIMRNVGATNHFIRAPFLWEGILTGIIGAILPVALSVYAYFLLYKSTGGILISNMFRLANPEPYAYYLGGLLLAIGILVGMLGSLLSINKLLRWKR